VLWREDLDTIWRLRGTFNSFFCNMHNNIYNENLKIPAPRQQFSVRGSTSVIALSRTRAAEREHWGWLREWEREGKEIWNGRYKWKKWIGFLVSAFRFWALFICLVFLWRRLYVWNFSTAESKACQCAFSSLIGVTSALLKQLNAEVVWDGMQSQGLNLSRGTQSLFSSSTNSDSSLGPPTLLSETYG
jgi:hypothetical protein